MNQSLDKAIKNKTKQNKRKKGIFWFPSILQNLAATISTHS